MTLTRLSINQNLYRDQILNGVVKAMVDFKTKIKKPRIKPYVSIDEVEIDIENTPPGSITIEQYRNARANSPGFHLLYTKLNNEALIEATNQNLNNCRYSTYISEATYEWALQNVLVPELLKRLACEV